MFIRRDHTGIPHAGLAAILASLLVCAAIVSRPALSIVHDWTHEIAEVLELPAAELHVHGIHLHAGGVDHGDHEDHNGHRSHRDRSRSCKLCFELAVFKLKAAGLTWVPAVIWPTPTSLIELVTAASPAGRASFVGNPRGPPAPLAR